MIKMVQLNLNFKCPKCGDERSKLDCARGYWDWCQRCKNALKQITWFVFL